MITLFNLHKMHKDTVYPPEGWAFSYLHTEQQQPKIVLHYKTYIAGLLGKAFFGYWENI